MAIWLALFYGALQGITEFLPISSSGHLVLFNKIFGTNSDFLFFSLLLHIATLFAVVVVLWKEIKFLIKNPFSPLAKKLYLSTLITILIVLAFEGFFKSAFGGAFLPICFLITAFLLLFTEFYSKKQSKKLSNKSAIMIGIAQGIAVLPGISRSGATICAGILCGMSRSDASRFSFLMSIPIIFASMFYEVFDAIKNGTAILSVPVLPSLIAFLTAFIVGVLCVNFMLKAIQKIKLWWFSIYLICISILTFFFL